VYGREREREKDKDLNSNRVCELAIYGGYYKEGNPAAGTPLFRSLLLPDLSIIPRRTGILVLLPLLLFYFLFFTFHIFRIVVYSVYIN
jgi:hypothetical protein